MRSRRPPSGTRNAIRTPAARRGLHGELAPQRAHPGRHVGEAVAVAVAAGAEPAPVVDDLARQLRALDRQADRHATRRGVPGRVVQRLLVDQQQVLALLRAETPPAALLLAGSGERPGDADRVEQLARRLAQTDGEARQVVVARVERPDDLPGPPGEPAGGVADLFQHPAAPRVVGGAARHLGEERDPRQAGPEVVVEVGRDPRPHPLERQGAAQPQPVGGDDQGGEQRRDEGEEAAAQPPGRRHDEGDRRRLGAGPAPPVDGADQEAVAAGAEPGEDHAALLGRRAPAGAVAPGQQVLVAHRLAGGEGGSEVVDPHPPPPGRQLHPGQGGAAEDRHRERLVVDRHAGDPGRRRGAPGVGPGAQARQPAVGAEPDRAAAVAEGDGGLELRQSVARRVVTHRGGGGIEPVDAVDRPDVDPSREILGQASRVVARQPRGGAQLLPSRGGRRGIRRVQDALAGGRHPQPAAVVAEERGDRAALRRSRRRREAAVDPVQELAAAPAEPEAAGPVLDERGGLAARRQPGRLPEGLETPVLPAPAGQGAAGAAAGGDPQVAGGVLEQRVDAVRGQPLRGAVACQRRRRGQPLDAVRGREPEEPFGGSDPPGPVAPLEHHGAGPAQPGFEGVREPGADAGEAVAFEAADEGADAGGDVEGSVAGLEQPEHRSVRQAVGGVEGHQAATGQSDRAADVGAQPEVAGRILDHGVDGLVAQAVGDGVAARVSARVAPGEGVETADGAGPEGVVGAAVQRADPASGQGGDREDARPPAGAVGRHAPQAAVGAHPDAPRVIDQEGADGAGVRRQGRRAEAAAGVEPGESGLAPQPQGPLAVFDRREQPCRRWRGGDRPQPRAFRPCLEAQQPALAVGPQGPTGGAQQAVQRRGPRRAGHRDRPEQRPARSGGRTAAVEAVEATIGRHPQGAAGVLDQVVDPGARQAVGGTVAGEAGAVETGQPGRGAEPQDAPRVADRAAYVVVAQAVDGAVRGRRQALAGGGERQHGGRRGGEGAEDPGSGARHRRDPAAGGGTAGAAHPPSSRTSRKPRL